jgi:hypothetical protein
MASDVLDLNEIKLSFDCLSYMAELGLVKNVEKDGETYWYLSEPVAGCLDLVSKNRDAGKLLIELIRMQVSRKK